MGRKPRTQKEKIIKKELENLDKIVLYPKEYRKRKKELKKIITKIDRTIFKNESKKELDEYNKE